MNRYFKKACSALIAFSITAPILSCSHRPVKTQAAAPAAVAPEEDKITEDEARLRKSQVNLVNYDLNFELQKGQSEYRAHNFIHLRLARTDAPLRIDYKGLKPSVTVNGAEVTDLTFRLGSFSIPAKYLRPETLIEITYTNRFNESPSGFYRSVDPVDHKEYLYTDFEPYQAHWLFPCLDQPDVKATYRLTVLAPKSWKVISNALPSFQKVEGQLKRTTFEPIRPISTYLFFLGAGDYHEWRSNHGKTPLFLYSRQSIAKFVDSGNIFDITKKGLSFYEKYFNQPYPFPKYGQLFIPDFNWGGMENPGAITLNEKTVFRGKQTDAMIRKRVDLILHEMAHMWFGDLVTMQWWNDLWLNESFATYMAALAQADALKNDASWSDFLGEKSWGYWQDTLVTTHPIEAVVPDTVVARNNFDGISYGKGASSLKQLSFYVGAQAFQTGVQSYFRKFAGKNTLRADFINEIAQASGKGLQAWTHAWLQTAGPNTVSAEWKCKDGKISAFTLHQKPSVSGTLAPHRTLIGLYDRKQDGSLTFRNSESVNYEKASTEVPALLAQTCPTFAYPNEGDQDYAIFSLDPTSLEAVKTGLSTLPTPLVRLMAWQTLNQMVRDGGLSPKEYIEITTKALETESNSEVLGSVLGRHSTLREHYFWTLPASLRSALAPKLESVLWKRIDQAPPGSDLQLGFFDFAVSVSRTASSRDRLALLFDGKSMIPGLKLDQDRRWQILNNLAASGLEGISERVNAESARDTSSRGQAFAYAASIAVPDPLMKQKAWKEFLTPGALKENVFNQAEGSFQDPNHPELEQPYVYKFFETLETLDWTNEVHQDRIESYFGSLFPSCTPDVLLLSEQRLKSTGVTQQRVIRAWREANDELNRCIHARKLI